MKILFKNIGFQKNVKVSLLKLLFRKIAFQKTFKVSVSKLLFLSHAAACDGTAITTTANGQNIAAETLPTF